MSRIGKSALRGAREALAYLEGDRSRGTMRTVLVPEDVDVAAIRRKLGLSQARFATSFGFNLRTLQDWEQGRYRPEASARALLTIIDREPKAVQRALRLSTRSAA